MIRFLFSMYFCIFYGMMYEMSVEKIFFLKIK